MLERFSIECCIIKTKVITKANRRKESALKSQWELRIKPTKLPKARENAGDQVVIGFNFESDWLREWRELPHWRIYPTNERNCATKLQPYYYIANVHLAFFLSCYYLTFLCIVRTGDDTFG